MHKLAQSMPLQLRYTALAVAIGMTMALVALTAVAAGAGLRPISDQAMPNHPSDHSRPGDVIVWKGALAQAPTSFTGQWIIATESETRTIVLSTTTDVADFRGQLPGAGAWIEARGQIQNDGTLIAYRVRTDDFEMGQVVVRLVPGVISTTLLHEDGYHLKLLPNSTLLASANIYLFGTDERERDLIGRLNADPRVVWADYNYVNGIPNVPVGDPYRTWGWGGADPTSFVNQAAFTQVKLPEAQRQWLGRGVVVAVLDTGIDLAHPAFAGKLLAGTDLVSDDAEPQDECCGDGWGHGTHVAGIIAHIAPAARLLPVRVLDTNGRGNTFVLAYAIEWAVQNGAQVINLSLGAEADSAVLSDTIAAAVAKGVIIAAAAGNNDSSAPQLPAAYPGVLAVTAVDADEHKAVFANFGRDWIKLAAPGVGITSTIVGPQGSGYAVWSGTSMATPFVSGAAALAREEYPAATAQAIGNLLILYGANLDPLNPGYAGQLGHFLDIGSALAAGASDGSGNPPLNLTAHRVFLPAAIH